MADPARELDPGPVPPGPALDALSAADEHYKARFDRLVDQDPRGVAWFLAGYVQAATPVPQLELLLAELVRSIGPPNDRDARCICPDPGRGRHNRRCVVHKAG